MSSKWAHHDSCRVNFLWFSCELQVSYLGAQFLLWEWVSCVLKYFTGLKSGLGSLLIIISYLWFTVVWVTKYIWDMRGWLVYYIDKSSLFQDVCHNFSFWLSTVLITSAHERNTSVLYVREFLEAPWNICPRAKFVKYLSLVCRLYLQMFCEILWTVTFL